MMAGFDLHSFCACCHDKKRGQDPFAEKPNVECQLCKALTPEQVSQLATPSYKLKKEKHDKAESTPPKKDSSSSTSVTLSPTLVDPARVSVIRAVDGQDTGLSAQPAEKKKKVEEKKKSVKPKPSTSTAAAVSTDQKFQELDQIWSDRFNQLEAILLAFLTSR